MVLDGGFEDCVDRLCMTYKNILSMLVFGYWWGSDWH